MEEVRWKVLKPELTRPELALHHGEISPEIRQALRAAEERREIGRVHEHDVAGALFFRRHPEQGVELRVAGRGEGMRPVEIDGLTRQHMHRLCVLGRQLVVRQVRVEIERGDVLEQPELVEVTEGRERRDLLRAFDDRRAESPFVDDGDVERLHQRAGVLAEALLARHERVAVMEVLHLALLQVVGEADIVVRRKQQAGAFALEPLADRRDFLRRRLLLGREMV